MPRLLLIILALCLPLGGLYAQTKIPIHYDWLISKGPTTPYQGFTNPMAGTKDIVLLEFKADYQVNPQSGGAAPYPLGVLWHLALHNDSYATAQDFSDIRLMSVSSTGALWKIASTTSLSAYGALEFSNLNVPLSNQSNTFRIVADISPNATVGDMIDLSLTPSAQTVGVGPSVNQPSVDPLSKKIDGAWFSIDPPRLTITSPTQLPRGFENTDYTYQFTKTGGNQSYAWTVGSPALPSGWQLDSTGKLSIPAASATAGSYTFKVVVSDGKSSDSQTCNLDIVVPLKISNGSLPGGTEQSPYTATLGATGGTTPYQWTATGLPTGWTLSGNQIVAPATDVVRGSYSFTIGIQDSSPTPLTDSVNYTVTVVPSGSPLTITSTSIGPFQQGQGCNLALYAQGGTPPYTWSAASLPGGFTLNAAGQLANAMVTLAPGSYSFDATVEDSVQITQTATISFDVTAPPALTIQTASLPPASVNKAWSATLNGAGGGGTYQWRLAYGFLPPGITGLTVAPQSGTPDVTLSGTPTTAGDYDFTVQLDDSLGYSTIQAYTLTVGAQGVSKAAGKASSSGCTTGSGGGAIWLLLLLPMLAWLRRRRA